MYDCTYATYFSTKREHTERSSFELQIMFIESRVQNLWSSKFITLKWSQVVPLFLSIGGEKKDHIKNELIGGGSPRHLNTFLTCLLLLYTTHIAINTL